MKHWALAASRTSPNRRRPPVSTKTVFMWPTTLYVRLDVAPMAKNVDRLTRTPSRDDSRIMLLLKSVYSCPKIVSCDMHTMASAQHGGHLHAIDSGSSTAVTWVGDQKPTGSVTQTSAPSISVAMGEYCCSSCELFAESSRCFDPAQICAAQRHSMSGASRTGPA